MTIETILLFLMYIFLAIYVIIMHFESIYSNYAFESIYSIYGRRKAPAAISIEMLHETCCIYFHKPRYSVRK